jgi:hypothetical protein
MKHAFKKSLLAATLCVVGMGMTYSAASSADMIFKYEDAYAANPDNPTIPAPSVSGGGDGVLAFTDPAPALPPETGAQQDIDVEPGENDPQINATGICNTPEGEEEEGSAMTGESMVGKIKIVFKYSDLNDSGDIDWVAGADLGTGYASDGIWELSHKGNTFEKPWRLKLVSDVLAPQDPKLIGVVIKTSTYNVVKDKYKFITTPMATAFDIYYEPEMTPGSGRGRPFEVTAYPDNIARPQGEYGIPVLLKGSWYGDLFSWLTISIPGGWDGSESSFIDFVLFLADTDCILAIDVVDLESSVTPGGVKLSWADESRGGIGIYVIFRTTESNYQSCIAGGDCVYAKPIDTTANEVYIDSTVEADESYRYAVLELEGDEGPGDDSVLRQLMAKYNDGSLAMTVVTP